MTSVVRIRSILDGEHTGKQVTVRGWVHRIRSSGKIVFAVVRDATGTIQTTTKKGVVADDGFDHATLASMEASVIVTGEIVADERAPGGFELKATGFRLVGPSHDFPIYESTVEAESDELLNKRHLWLRSRQLTHAMILKAKMLAAFREGYAQGGYYETTPSVITTNACEGGSTLFTFDYFGQEAFLSQSSQMYLEALAYSLEKVWCLTPSFRAEKSRTRKHLTEFGHLEAEMAWMDYKDNMDEQEKLVSYVARRVAETAEEELVALGREPADLKRITTPFPRITYDDAVDRLKKRGFPDFEWGEDFGVPHERALMEGEEKPMFISLWPAEIKAFYMALDEDGVSARCSDLLAPGGYGEIIGGSERSLDIDLMTQRLRKEGAAVENYEWYFDLRRYGAVPHSGYGLGTERVLTWLGNLAHIRDATPFPRTPARAYP